MALPDPDPALSEVDREALTRAIEVAKAESAQQRAQIENMLKQRDWLRVARFAAYCCQDRALALELWQVPPCWLQGGADEIDDILKSDRPDRRGLRRAAALVKRLEENGLSRYEPDPVGALEAMDHRGRA